MKSGVLVKDSIDSLQAFWPAIQVIYIYLSKGIFRGIDYFNYRYSMEMLMKLLKHIVDCIVLQDQ